MAYVTATLNSKDDPRQNPPRGWRTRIVVILAILVALWQPTRAQDTIVTTRWAERQSIVLSGRQTTETTKVALSAQTSTVRVRLKRPTTGDLTVIWGDTSTLEIVLEVDLNGELFRAVGRATGGIRPAPHGGESAVSELSYTLPWGYFGEATTKRLGERAVITTYTGLVRIALVAGPAVTTELLLAESEDAPVPVMARHNSVAFDIASDISEQSMDGVATLTHTPSGSSNLAAFAGVGATDDGGDPITSTSVVYAGTTMTELWDLAVGSDHVAAGYSLANNAVPASAQTVTSTVSGGAFFHVLGVVTMTGVDQTTPVGTAVTTTTTQSVTVGTVGADDLVVDALYTVAEGTVTAGASQTERYRESRDALYYGVGSTQPGADGGVMSWTVNDVIVRGLGGVAFKPATAAAAPKRLLTLGAGE